MKQLNEHDHDEECCCHECKEKQLSEKEIERIIEENYSEKDEKTKKFIRKSLKIHGLEYNYDKTVFIRSIDKVIITCQIHGDFSVFPGDHIKANREIGCPTCGKLKIIMKRRDTADDFIRKSEKLYPGRLDYSNVEYVNSRTKVILTCKKHGTKFNIKPASHLSGNFGCPDCAKEAVGLFSKYTISELQEALNSIYGDGVYVIPEQKYEGVYVDIRVHDIKWNEDFVTKPAYLLSGTGNPNHRNKSTGEQIIIDWCKENSIIFNYQTKITGEGITGRNSSGYVIVDFKLTYNNLPIIIEYNGEQHYKNIPFFHKTPDSFEKQIKRDEELRNYCKNNEIKLIEIPYIVEDVSGFLTKTVIENIDPLTLVDYDSLYVVNDNST